MPSALAGGANPFSDDLNACDLADVLDNGWSLIDPLGSATVESVGGGSGVEAFLRVALPSGSNYDPWNLAGNRALRLVQAVNGVGDLEVEVAFLTDPVDGFDSQGLMFLEEDLRFVRVEVYRDDVGDSRLFVGTRDGIVRETRLDVVLDPGEGDTRFLRVEYDATLGEWRVWSSVDGTGWTRRTGEPIDFPLATAEIGLAAANTPAANSFTAEFDYFRNLAEPFDPVEDSSTLPDCSICGNGTINAGEACDDGNTVDGDGCSSGCETGCGTGVNVFSQMVLATDRRTFEWELPVDMVYALGDFAQLDGYGTLASGVVLGATSLDVGGTPPPGTGLYLLFRVNCPLSTWSSGTSGECCDRDASLP